MWYVFVIFRNAPYTHYTFDCPIRAKYFAISAEKDERVRRTIVEFRPANQRQAMPREE